MEKKKTNVGTLLIAIFILVTFPLAFLYGLGGGDLDFIENIFTGKSDKCKQEAYERSESLRDSELEGLKLKKIPTSEDLQEIERLEIQKKTNLIDRDDNNYFYEDCMK